MPKDFSRKRLFESGCYADLIIRCKDGVEYKFHKNVVCTQCEFFANAVNGRFKESEGVITLPNDPPAAIYALLQHLYGISYTEDDANTPSVIFHVQVYTVAEIYNIPKLKGLAAGRFTLAALQKTETTNADLATAITQAYEATPETDGRLRDAARDVVITRFDELSADAAFMAAVKDAGGGFGMVLARELRKRLRKVEVEAKAEEVRTCSHCGKEWAEVRARVMLMCPACGTGREWLSGKRRKV